MHPHPGIATLTWQPGCDVQYEDTTGQKGTLTAGGLEWMNAGGGAWHQGFLQGSGLQLWLPMPPGVEDGLSIGQYVPPEQVRSLNMDDGLIKVSLSELTSGGTRIASPIESHHNLNYWVVGLPAGAQWNFTPPQSHSGRRAKS